MPTKTEDRLSRHAERITAVETLQGSMNVQVEGLSDKMDKVQYQLSWQTKILAIAGTLAMFALGWIAHLIGKFIDVYLGFNPGGTPAS